MNPYELIRKYKCQSCGEIMMCACEQEIGTRFLSHQLQQATDLESQNRVTVTAGFVENICNECRGQAVEAYPKAELYGRTSKILRYYWREIQFETMRRFADKYKCADNQVATQMAINQKISDQTEKEVVKEIKKLHEISPKYIYKQESAAEIIEKYNVNIINLKANYVKTDERKVKIEENGTLYSAEEYAGKHLTNQNYEVVPGESIPFHVLFGTLMCPLIQDNSDDKCRLIILGDRFAFESNTQGPQIWTSLPRDFGTTAYYSRRKSKIKKHFESFPEEPEDLIKLFDLWLGPSTNLRQYLWAHREEDIERARKILSLIPTEIIYNILKYLIGDYWGRYIGWPDIIAKKDNKIELFEVKSSKDKLREDQKEWIKGNYNILNIPFSIIKIHRNTK